VPEEIIAAQATRILQSAKPSGPAGRLAAELLEEMRRLDAQVRESRKKLAIAVKGIGHQPDWHLRRRPGHRRHRDGDVARFSFTASGVAFNGGSRWAGARQAG
jgi:hypothetical protein